MMSMTGVVNGVFFFFQAEDGIRDLVRSRGLGDVYKRQDRSRPLWELVVIEGLDGIDFLPKGSFALFLKMHHAAVDGMAALTALEVLHDEHPRPAQRVVPQLEDDEPGPGTNRMLGNAGLNALRSPARWWRLAKELVPAVRFIGTGVREGRFGTASPRVNTRFNTRISSYRVVESAFFALDELQLMRKAESGATVNDVVVTIIGGAMRRYLQSRGELGDSSPCLLYTSPSPRDRTRPRMPSSA